MTVGPGHVSGGHFTVSTRPEELDVLFEKWHGILNENRPPIGMYVCGPVAQWGNMQLGAKNASDMAKLFKKKFNYNGKCYVYDQEGIVTATYRVTHHQGQDKAVLSPPPCASSRRRSTPCGSPRWCTCP